MANFTRDFERIRKVNRPNLHVSLDFDNLYQGYPGVEKTWTGTIMAWDPHTTDGEFSCRPITFTGDLDSWYIYKGCKCTQMKMNYPGLCFRVVDELTIKLDEELRKSQELVELQEEGSDAQVELTELSNAEIVDLLIKWSEEKNRLTRAKFRHLCEEVGIKDTADNPENIEDCWEIYTEYRDDFEKVEKEGE